MYLFEAAAACLVILVQWRRVLIRFDPEESTPRTWYPTLFDAGVFLTWDLYYNIELSIFT